MLQRPVTILVVDDDERLLKNIGSELGRHGFKLTGNRPYISINERNPFVRDDVTVVLTGRYHQAIAALDKSDHLKAIFVDFFLERTRYTVTAHFLLNNNAILYAHATGTGVEIADLAFHKHNNDIQRYGAEGKLSVFCISGLGGKMSYLVKELAAAKTGNSEIATMRKDEEYITREILVQMQGCGVEVDYTAKPASTDPMRDLFLGAGRKKWHYGTLTPLVS